MELDDASIASFATARVYKVLGLLSSGWKSKMEAEEGA